MMPFGPIGQPPNKKKPGELIHNIKPLLKELMGPRWPRLVVGLILVIIGRTAGLIAPASTRFLVVTHNGLLFRELSPSSVTRQ